MANISWMYLGIWLVTSFILGCSCLESLTPDRNISHQGSVEHQLLNHLLDAYPHRGSEIRPKKNARDAVEVLAEISLVRIFGVDEVQQSVQFRAYFTMAWHDDFLVWDEDDYQGVSTVSVSREDIWHPDMAIYDEVSQSCIHDESIIVKSTGYVFYIPTCVYTILCKVDIAKFPFDRHNCSLVFGSWTYHTEALHLSNRSRMVKTMDVLFSESPEWNLEGYESIIETVEAANLTYDIVRCSFTIRRHAPVFAYLFILPAVLLSVITSVVFLLPPSNPDKINIGLGILLSFMIMLNILMEQTPKSASTVPLIGYYLTLGSLLISMSVFSSTILQNMFTRASRTPRASSNLKQIFLVIGGLLCVKYRKREQIYSSEQKDSNHRLHVDKSDEKGPRAGAKRAFENGNEDLECSYSEEENDWVYMARVIDRLFFLLYVIINVVASTIIFSQILMP